MSTVRLLTILILGLNLTKNANSYEFIGVKIEGKPNIFAEAKFISLSNSDEAQELGEDWDSAQATVIRSNIGFTLDIAGHEFIADWYLRSSHSKIIKDDHYARNYTFYPNKIIARDLFKLHKTDQSSGRQFESVLNKFTYTIGDSEASFKAGRMSVNFGEGLTANPINPFNISKFYAYHAEFNQGNDGAMIRFSKDPKLVLHIYLFGDKSYTDYDEAITRTLLIRGDWQYKPDIFITYILGEDQERHKYGIQIKKFQGASFGFMQIVRFSQKLNTEEAHEKGLVHYIIGGEYDHDKKLSARVEFGRYQFPNNNSELNRLSNQFIPIENFIGVHGQFRHSDSLNSKLSLVKDLKSNFSYSKYEFKYAVQKHIDIFTYYSLPLQPAEEKHELNFVQNSMPSEVGLGIRGHF
jgi:hypothetical protein